MVWHGQASVGALREVCEGGVWEDGVGRVG